MKSCVSRNMQKTYPKTADRPAGGKLGKRHFHHPKGSHKSKQGCWEESRSELLKQLRRLENEKRTPALPHSEKNKMGSKTTALKQILAGR